KSGGFSSGTSFSNSSIPSGNITVSLGSTIELYSLTDQGLNKREDFANLIFSGGGRKTPGNRFNPNGTITIKDNAIFDCTGHNIGDASTNLTMTDDSRLIVETTSTQPSMEGTYNLTCGTIEFTNNSATIQSIRTITGNYNNIEVSGKNVNNSNGNINLNPGGSFTINPKGTFTINDDAITGSKGVQTLTIRSGGTFNCGSSFGFYGALVGLNSPSVKDDIEYIILEPGSAINYSRSKPPLTDGDQMITLIGQDGTIPYQNLILSGNGNKTAPAGTLGIKGDLTKKGSAVFVHNAGTVLLDGSNEQTYSSTIPPMVFNNLTKDNAFGLNINDRLSVYRELLLGDNSKININADITLLSDNNNTANVAPITEGSVINYYEGRFIVERYIPNHSKAWQFLSATTKGSTIKDSWMEGNIADDNANPGFGTLISSNRATWDDDGFDLFSPGGPSMKTFDPVSNSWEGITSTSNKIDNQSGYMLFIRGDRSTHFGDPVTATTMRTRGKLYAPGSEAPNPVNVQANSFHSVSNPYASAIDFNRILSLSPGISNAYYVWDPQLTTYPSAYGLGAYRTISGNVSVPSSDNYTDGNIPPIQSGQAFLVRNQTADEHTLKFDESVKVNGSRNIFREGDIEEPKAKLRLNLFAIHEDQPVLVDGVLTLFHDSYSNKTDDFDAMKLHNSNENVGIWVNAKVLAIERRAIAREYDTLFYHLEKLKPRTYQLELIGHHLDHNGMAAFLEDHYLNTSTFIQSTGATDITFSVNADPTSSSKNRFSVIFRPADNPVPLFFLSVNAWKYNNDIIVEWKVENEDDILQYEAERSTNGLHFNTIAMLPVQNSSQMIYNCTDLNPADGPNYYRIKSVAKGGKIVYSKVVKTYNKNLNPVISIYPNPVEHDMIRLYFSKMAKGNYSMKLYNSTGQRILSDEMNCKGENDHHFIPLNKNTPPGVYHLEITKPNGFKTILNLIK
ncbi:MAG: T9SS type A sorting domain-containing protein, partial [Ginsengibacter sp.]